MQKAFFDPKLYRDTARGQKGTFFNDTETNEIYTLPLHDALPI